MVQLKSNKKIPTETDTLTWNSPATIIREMDAWHWIWPLILPITLTLVTAIERWYATRHLVIMHMCVKFHEGLSSDEEVKALIRWNLARFDLWTCSVSLELAIGTWTWCHMTPRYINIAVVHRCIKFHQGFSKIEIWWLGEEIRTDWTNMGNTICFGIFNSRPYKWNTRQ